LCRQLLDHRFSSSIVVKESPSTAFSARRYASGPVVGDATASEDDDLVEIDDRESG
jgi:hypothetical protein